ncbi:Trehalase [Heterocephalus glaber]|uniref:Trehalase n=1 Tax=Heterocephalus glaber TaxID=10181 RepID=G5BHM4_HETGA|nr:Trehalase [Heterocephalus glaber]
MPVRTWELPLLLLLGLGLRSQEALPPPCESQIYCHGELLHQVQMAKLYPDDKQFVDMSLSAAPHQVLQSFSALAAAHNHGIPKQQLQEFVQQYFQPVGQELLPWTPEDWKESPQFLQKISDSKLRAWAEELHQIWKKLGKKMKPEVVSHPERFSLISSEHPFIVPGGRFVEFYYWDSYRVREGLLLSEMAETVRGMLQNFLDLVKTENIETLALELDFWTVNRTVSVNLGRESHILNRYYVPYGGPRPESYSKDEELANTLPKGDPEALWAELKAGAESGWDFSSRWLVGSPHPDLLSSIQTSKQDEQKGAWFNYDLENRKKNLEFYPSNLTPLWAGCFSDPGVVDKALKYLEDSQILTYQYGIPTSLRNTGQQWDFPNGWAPLQDLVIRGLAKSSSPRTQEVAFQLAQNWIRTNFDVYSQKSAMYEKYDISNGQPGSGGEYEVQERFGWTNGVALMLLDHYGDRLTSGTQLALLMPHCLVATFLFHLLLSFLS